MITRPLRAIDGMLNRLTMYQILVYGLAVIIVGSVILNLTGALMINWLAILLSAVVILATTFVADYGFRTLWNAPANQFSSLITGLILICILPPSRDVHHLAILALGGLIAIGSKYILAIHRKHILNPAAIAALILGLTSLAPATWWVGSPAVLPITLLLGILVLRKLRRFQLFFSFLIASLLVAIFVGLHNDQSITAIVRVAFLSSPLVFLGTVMLTEPTTMPPRQWQRYIYGAIVGGLFTSQLHAGIVSATPEAALIIGNIYSYLVSPKYKLKLTFNRKEQLAPQIYEFTFTGAKKLRFKPGQYLEWTLGQHKSDARGNRRTFSIASIPQSDEVRIAIRVSEVNSTFKRDLMQLKAGDHIMAGQLTGDFVLSEKTSQKVVFIAGGIGITPFVSMARAMIHDQQKRDIVLFYLVSQASDYCYKDLWQQAKQYGLHVVPVLTNAEASGQWSGLTGRLTGKLIEDTVADYKDRDYYISGPPGLVQGYRQLLRQISIKPQHIITDYFSGY